MSSSSKSLSIDAPSRSLSVRLRTGAIWNVFGQLTNVVVRFGSNLLLTRLLEPSMFGVMSLATTLMICLQMFTDVGLRPWLVQSKRGEEPAVINTLWTIQATRGIFIGACTVLVGLALWLAQTLHLSMPDTAYGNAQLPWVIVLLALVPIIGGFESTKPAEAQRVLNFGALTRLGLYCQLISVPALILMVYLTRSIWALVAGSLVSITATVLFSHLYLAGTRNRFAWNTEVVDEIRRFGRWIIMSSIIGYFANNADRLILGGAVSATQLGVYSVAATIVGMLGESLQKLGGDLALPTFSEVYRDRPQDLRRVFYKFRLPIEVIALLSAGGLAACGESAINWLYDARYADAGWMVEILAISLLVQRHRLASSLVLAMGDSRIMFFQAISSTACLAGLAALGLWLDGLRGFLFGVAIAPVVAVLPVMTRVWRAGLIDWYREVYLLPLLGVGYLGGMVAARVFDMLPHIHH